MSIRFFDIQRFVSCFSKDLQLQSSTCMFMLFTIPANRMIDRDCKSERKERAFFAEPGAALPDFSIAGYR